jgi:type I restriction-modification system DNA methylase subunit
MKIFFTFFYRHDIINKQKGESMKKMSNWLNTTSFNKKDEYYTPRILVDVIVDFVPKEWVVWCPFDTEESEFVKAFKENGNKVIYSHIWNGQDFFKYTPEEEYDCIISNPPFTRKLEVLEKLYQIGKPFAMVLGLPILNYQEVGCFFLDKELQLLIVDKKISFDGNTASFNNSYFCHKLLPKDIIFKHLEHNNSNRHFKASSMSRKRE